MQVQFKRPVTIGKETYGKGVHNVPDADVKDNWFFDGLVKEGNAIILRKDEEQSAPAVEAEVKKPAAKKGKQTAEAE
jgi:hypothetical protein